MSLPVSENMIDRQLAALQKSIAIYLATGFSVNVKLLRYGRVFHLSMATSIEFLLFLFFFLKRLRQTNFVLKEK